MICWLYGAVELVREAQGGNRRKMKNVILQNSPWRQAEPETRHIFLASPPKTSQRSGVYTSFFYCCHY